MGKSKRMDQVRLIISTYLETSSIGKTVSRLKVSKNTVRRYLRKAEAYMYDLGALLSLSDEELSAVFYSKPQRQGKRRKHGKYGLYTHLRPLEGCGFS